MDSIDFKETGKIELYYLKKIWFHFRNTGVSNQNAEQQKVYWKYINAVFSVQGIGTEPAIKYPHQ